MYDVMYDESCFAPQLCVQQDFHEVTIVHLAVSIWVYSSHEGVHLLVAESEPELQEALPELLRVDAPAVVLVEEAQGPLHQEGSPPGALVDLVPHGIEH